MATRIIPKTELRERLHYELAELGDDTLVITGRGRAVAVAVSISTGGTSSRAAWRIWRTPPPSWSTGQLRT